MNTYGVGASYTLRVHTWTQASSSIWTGVAGLGEVRVGLGANLKRFETCVFDCHDGRAADGYVRGEFVKYHAPHFALQAVVDAGVSVLDLDETESNEVYLLLAARAGLVLTI
ncbi:MAG: hypothetical protein NT062_10840 [Proteobacteria bacterium]|nr:hypothetical protein [Pseudomonadota bacterium]